jgi:hypothetical protein
MDCVKLLSYLGDGLVWALKKDVPSCEKPWGGAWSLRSKDLRMGLPVLWTLRKEGEPGALAGVEATLKYHPVCTGALTSTRNPGQEQRQAGGGSLGS